MASKKKSSGKNSGPRELIQPHPGDKRYQRRTKTGHFGESDDVTKSLREDVKKHSKTKVKPGYGDRGDQPKRTAKKK